MLRFFTAIAGPVFAKEMVEMARRKRYYFNRVFLGLALLFALFMVYQSNRSMWEGYGGNSIQAVARFAEQLFVVASSVQYAAVYLFVPLFLCGVIATEREEKTLELLFTTQLKDREIVLGKLLSRLAALVALILCAMPVMSLITLLGGIDPVWIWRVLASTLLATVFVGAHAIYFSAITKSPMGAVVRTYFWLVVGFIALPLAGGMIVEAIRPLGPPRWLLDVYFALVAFFHPLGSFIPALLDEAYDELQRTLTREISPALGRWFFPATFALPLMWSAFLVWRAVRRLRLPPSILGGLLLKLPGVRHFRDWRRRRREARRGGRGLAWADRWLFIIPIANPLWLRARVARVYDREGHIGRLQWGGWAVAAGFLVLIVTLDPRALREAEVSMTFQAPVWIAIAALAVILSGMSLTADRRRGFFELVLVTPLSARAVIDGTLLAVWQHLRRLYWLLPALALVFVLSGANELKYALPSVFTATLFCALIVVNGVGCSLAARTMPGALLSTIALPAVVLVGLPCFAALFKELHGPIFWVLAILFLVVCFALAQNHQSVVIVACLLIGMHLASCGIFTCWLYDGRHEELPLLAMHPGFLVMVLLEKWPYRGPLDHWGVLGRDIALPAYWLALGLNLVWARWWLIRNFDRLVGRPGQRGEAPVMAVRLLDEQIARAGSDKETRRQGDKEIRGARVFPLVCVLGVAAGLVASAGWAVEPAKGDTNWPRWRGADGSGVADGFPLPVRWSTTENVRWKTPIPGEGASSPIVWNERVFATSAQDRGQRRAVHCLDRRDGKLLWSREIKHANPEIASAVTGHAAATPATDGERVVAFFGNAGVVCYDFEGKLLWQRDLGEFDSELGLASSPVILGERVILVCDHDGTRFKSFDSFIIALDLKTGKEVWKTERPGLERSWSTPIFVEKELIVNAQDELRGYDPANGKHLWTVRGMTGWVTPSPVYGHGLIFATSGKAGPVLAVRPGGRGDVTATHVAWKHENVGSYVCSPLLYGEHLYIHNELGILSCYQARTGNLRYRERLGGKFTASGVAGDGKLYLTNEDGTTIVIRAGEKFEVLAKNELKEYTVASPAVSRGEIFVRTEKHLWCVAVPR